MPRIRSVKPGYFTDEYVAELSIACRLHFIGLWTVADDAGRGLDHAKLLRAAIWPLDDDVTVAQVEAWQEELEAHGRIERYEVDGRHYFEIVRFRVHQKPNKPQPSKLPPSPTTAALEALDLLDDFPNELREPPGSAPVALPESSRSDPGSLQPRPERRPEQGVTAPGALRDGGGGGVVDGEGVGDGEGTPPTPPLGDEVSSATTTHTPAADSFATTSPDVALSEPRDGGSDTRGLIAVPALRSSPKHAPPTRRCPRCHDTGVVDLEGTTERCTCAAATNAS